MNSGGACTSPRALGPGDRAPALTFLPPALDTSRRLNHVLSPTERIPLRLHPLREARCALRGLPARYNQRISRSLLSYLVLEGVGDGLLQCHGVPLRPRSSPRLRS